MSSRPSHSGRLTPKIVLNANLVDSKLNFDGCGDFGIVENKVESNNRSNRPSKTSKINITKVMRKESKTNSNFQLSCNGTSSSKTTDNIDNGNNNDEIKQLKKLLLVHLDLIQQQQELVHRKDRVISLLQAEKDMLKCRLERMERRMSLGKHKISDTEGVKQDPSVLCSAESLKYNKSSSIKRKALLEPRNLSKRFATEGNIKQTDLADKPQHEPKNSITPTKQLKKDVQLPEARISHRPRRVPTEKEQTSSRPQFIVEQKVEEVKKELKQIESIGDDIILRTKSLYYSIPYRDIEPIDEDVGDRIKNVLSVEVPSWRLNPVQNRYVIEGTENLEDEIFSKRHKQPETDEKRRKRWDLQRSREQALYERLKQGYRCSPHGMAGSCRERDDSVSSFYPAPDDIGFIEVDEKIPVTAFGYPIPDLSAEEFEVPWLESCNKEGKQKNKNRPK